MQSVYRFFYTIHKNYSIKRQKSLPFKVISVGNITTGGTGKTPTVIEICIEARIKGYQPIILTRGYKGRRKTPSFVLSGQNLDHNLYSSNPTDVGDEPLLIANKLPCVPVVKAQNRYEGGLFAINNLERFKTDTGCDLLSNIIFILDDGFQHWHLYRDLDIVIIDGSNPFDNYKLLPLGRLREPLYELRRADIFLITRSFRQDVIDVIRKHNHQARIFYARTTPANLIDMSDNTLSLDILEGKKMLVFSGIGNNEQFKKMIQDSYSKDIHFMSFKDHHNYTNEDIVKIKKESDTMGCEFILTTEKDLIKIKHINPAISNIYAVEIRLEIEPEFYNLLFY